MEQSHLEALASWFEHYTQPFLDTDAEAARNIRLKIEHTSQVCQVMAQLCAGQRLSAAECRLAGAIALLHDVGRFPQYRRWRTFRDRDSDNHARLAIEVIRQHRLLDGCHPSERLLVEEAVRFHNLLTLPPRVQSPTRLFLNLIRDADKIDIWRVFVELLALPPHERASAATLGFEDLPDQISSDCVEALAAGCIVPLHSVKMLNDFKLLLISWVNDLNFPAAGRMIQERGYLPLLAASLPQRDDVGDAVERSLSTLTALSA